VDVVLRRLARAGRFRDEETAEHVERMSRTCALIARALGWDPDDCVNLRMASALHDLGKVGVPDAVLRKPGSLRPSERALVERHPEIGYEILADAGDELLDLAASVALTHHERVDGAGYPRGLSGAEIPLEGRIAAVADVFDALTHERVYRAAFAPEEALEMMRRGRGSQFDEGVFDAFEGVLPEVLEMSRLYPDDGQVDSGPQPETDHPPLPDQVVSPRPTRALSPREREIVTLLASGLTGEQIARHLFLSPATVKTHVRNAMTRLGAKTRPHLVMLAAERKELESVRPGTPPG
jgi:putative two-component system response regulator